MLHIKKRLSIRVIKLIIGAIFIFSNPAYTLATDFHNTLRPKHQLWTIEGQKRHRETQLRVLREHYGLKEVYTKKESLDALDTLRALGVPGMYDIHWPNWKKYDTLKTVRSLVEKDAAVLVQFYKGKLLYALISPLHAHLLSDTNKGKIVIHGITLPGPDGEIQGAASLDITPVFDSMEVEALVNRVLIGPKIDDTEAWTVIELLRNPDDYDLEFLKEWLESKDARKSRVAAAAIILRGGQFRMDGKFKHPLILKSLAIISSGL